MTNIIKDYKLRKIYQKVFTRFNTIIYYKARRYLCKSCGKSFIENNPFGNGRKKTPPAMILQILDALKPYNSTFSSVAKLYNVSVTTVISIFDKHVQISRKRLSPILCWDEFYFNRHSKYKYAFIVMDFKKKMILDILESRHSNIISDYFHNIPLYERQIVKFIIIDMYRNYRDIAHIFFPNAILCVDPFHVMKLVNDSLNTLRKRILRKYNGDKESKTYKLLKYRYRLLLKNRGELETEKKFPDKILAHLTTERDLLDIILSIDEQLSTGYYLKERFVSFNNSDASNYDGRVAKESILCEMITLMLNSNINEFMECAKTLNSWKEEILNSFTWIEGRRLSNGPIEGKNTYIKKIISNANGLNNFARARNKFMYSQNLYETYSLAQHTKTIKRVGAARGTYKKVKES